MIKIVLFPFIIALIALVLIAVFAKRGNAVSRIARDVPKPPERSMFWLWLPVIAIGGAWLTVWLLPYPVSTDSLVFLVVLTAAGIFAMMAAVAFAAFDVTCALAPIAAEVGEECSDSQKRWLLRHGIRWFKRLRNN